MSESTKIGADQLGRSAIVYIRQSTQAQVIHNKESRLRQYSLKEKAEALGFTDIHIIDTDLGKSASGSERRPGFETLLSEVCTGKVGAVFAIEASRLARNGREWHTLLELCGLMRTLIVDHDGTYDPHSPNDRLLLGMKGTISEMELTVLRQRSDEALKQKARRGELLTTVAVGYMRGRGDRIEQDPDLRVRRAIDLVFEKFRELGSVRQVLLWFRHSSIKLPTIHCVDGERTVEWKLPVYNSVHHILTNPIYAGAYAFGRTYTERRVENGQGKNVAGHRRPQSSWPILICDHHVAYIQWHEYERNQALIGENANMKGAMARGSVKSGSALLAGILRCGRCGRKLHVCYSGTTGTVVRYGCRGAQLNHGTGRCINLGALKLERLVAEKVLEILSPCALEAADEVLKAKSSEQRHVREQKQLAIDQANYEALRAQRQYDMADPENRLVSAELEKRWDERLREVRRLESALEMTPAPSEALTKDELNRLSSWSRDLGTLWHDPSADVQLKKRIIRTVVKEIVVSVDGHEVRAVIHWAGGDHSLIRFDKNRSGVHRWRTDDDTQALILELSRLTTDTGVAIILNRVGRKTAKGNSWDSARIASFRNDHGIRAFDRDALKEGGEVLLEDAASILAISRLRLYTLVRKTLIPARQACPGAPWVLKLSDVHAFAQFGPCATSQHLLFHSESYT